ncbi:hypothetical protein CC80DRAFT_495152 [Byssothecium circinans]|uniref:Aminoglycoside phosphotransferase domain-containing protein n=1 Tax=Byssothecium circinans TaxID=147558 RepID=A0A6A5TIH5_9PLEO|nr:hypothetical protein CC80DRAFT_495152 [Byssothecium circinans]
MGVTTEEWQQQEREIIDEFFKVKVPEVLKESADTTCTEGSCIERGKQVIQADDLELVRNQGCNSFTLVCHRKSKIIQFRLRPFDTTIADLAHQIYGTKVPRTDFHGGFPLPLYSSDIIPGKVHVLQPFPEEFPIERQKKTVIDLGQFVAKATHFPQPKASYRADSWTMKSKETLDRLHRNSSLQAAPEIAEIVTRLLEKVHLLDLLPAVLTHHDFSEVNILVNDTGDVTGVIDFDGAGIEAFGMCIWGVYECFLGSMNDGKWSFHDQAAAGYPGQTVRGVLETAFWDSLWSSVSQELKEKREELEAAVRVALSIGTINRYFIRGMMDKIDESIKVHRLSLEYARGILPAVWKD